MIEQGVIKILISPYLPISEVKRMYEARMVEWAKIEHHRIDAQPYFHLVHVHTQH